MERRGGPRRRRREDRWAKGWRKWEGPAARHRRALLVPRRARATRLQGGTAAQAIDGEQGSASGRAGDGRLVGLGAAELCSVCSACAAGREGGGRRKKGGGEKEKGEKEKGKREKKRKERDGILIGTGVGMADHRKKFRGIRISDRRIWNDLSSASKSF